jgi:hypothetical protein
VHKNSVFLLIIELHSLVGMYDSCLTIHSLNELFPVLSIINKAAMNIQTGIWEPCNYFFRINGIFALRNYWPRVVVSSGNPTWEVEAGEYCLKKAWTKS